MARGLKMKARMKMPGRNAPGAPGKLAGAIRAAAAMQAPDGMVPTPPEPPQSPAGPLPAPPIPDAPMTPPTGATDGLGAGTGGLAVHPSLKGAKIASYEPRHSSKHR